MRTGGGSRRSRRATSGLGAMLLVGAALVAAACAPASRSGPAAESASSGAPRQAAAGGAADTGGRSSAGGPAVPAPIAASDNGSLQGTWVATNGDVLDFERTGPGTYRGTVLFASHCAPDTGPIQVTSQAPGRFVGTGPLDLAGTGWCGASGAQSIAIVVGANRSSAHVSSDGGRATQSWARTTFSVTGQLAVPGPNDEDQAEGSSSLAKTCNPATFASDRERGSVIATSFQIGGLPTAATLLNHFLDGSGAPVDFAAGSAVASEAGRSVPFQQQNQRMQGYVENQLDDGVAAVDLDRGQDVLAPIGFTDQSIPDLYWGFRGTQGLDVSGALAAIGGDYVGEVTYVIRDAYGFGRHDYLSGIGVEMRYLQTTCGAPFYPGGARWFPDSITVTVGVRLPVRPPS
jgi:hypothetical protein